jgi:hypothetical protein
MSRYEYESAPLVCKKSLIKFGGNDALQPGSFYLGYIDLPRIHWLKRTFLFCTESDLYPLKRIIFPPAIPALMLTLRCARADQRHKSGFRTRVSNRSGGESFQPHTAAC